MIVSVLLTGFMGAPPSSLVPSEELRTQFRKQVEARRAPESFTPPPVAPPPSAFDQSFTVRIEASADGWIRISKPVSPSQAEQLERRGVPRVPAKQEVTQEAIQEGRYHRSLRAGPSLQDAAGAALLEAWKGREVKVLLGRDPENGQLLLLELRRVDD